MLSLYIDSKSLTYAECSECSECNGTHAMCLTNAMKSGSAPRLMRLTYYLLHPTSPKRVQREPSQFIAKNRILMAKLAGRKRQEGKAMNRRACQQIYSRSHTRSSSFSGMSTGQCGAVVSRWLKIMWSAKVEGNLTASATGHFEMKS